MFLVRMIMWLMLLVPAYSHADRAIFYQPQVRDLALDINRWPAIFQSVRARGMDTVIVQWTAHGDAFSNPQSQKWLKNRLEDALNAGLKLIVGLNADPEVFVRLEQPVGVLEDYFRRQRYLDVELAKHWSSVLPVEKISGWYITLEIDDRRWRDEAAFRELSDHLQTESVELRKINDKPIYVSSFFAGHTDPDQYAGMLKQIKKQADVRILVQDGAGTGKLTLRERNLYLGILGDCKMPVADGIVYEIFRQTQHDQAFKAEPLERNQLNQVLKNRASCGKDTVLFSLRYLIDLSN